MVLDLDEGENTIALSSHEAPNFDGTTYASDVWPDFPLRSAWAPVVDRLTVSPLGTPLAAAPTSPVSVQVVPECRGRKPFVEVTVTNDSDERTDVTVAALGTERTRDTLRPGKSWTQPFPATGRSVDAGEVTVTAGGVSTTHAYDAESCR